jgi:hypothetical protein
MMQALGRWWHPVASIEARDMLHRAMRIALYRCITMATEIVVNLPALSGDDVFGGSCVNV